MRNRFQSITVNRNKSEMTDVEMMIVHLHSKFKYDAVDIADRFQLTVDYVQQVIDDYFAIAVD